MKISIIEAKEDLTKFVEMAQRGVEITITKNEVPACKIVGIHQPTIKRFGLLRGKATIPERISIIMIKAFWRCSMEMTIDNSHKER